MASDSLLVADAIATLLTASYTAQGFPLTAERQYEVEYDLGTMVGMKVDIYPISNEDIKPATRVESSNDLHGCILTIDRYTQPQAVPKSWMDDRVTLIEVALFKLLNEVEIPLMTVGDYEYWPKKINIVSVYDYVYYSQHKVFWCECEYTVSRLRVR